MSALLKKIPPSSQSTELQSRDKIALFLLDITKLEDVLQDCLWWDLSSHGHLNHRNKPQLAHIQTHTCMLDSYCSVIHITNRLLLSGSAY